MSRLGDILNKLADGAVLEEGVSGNWVYRKWSSGLAECWYRADVGTITLGTKLGNNYVSNYYRIQFPFTFTQPPSCVIGYEGNSVGYVWLEGGNQYNTTEDYSYGVRLARVAASSVVTQNNIFTCHAVGKWK